MTSLQAFPHEHLEASRRDERLQAEHRHYVAQARREHLDLVCPACGSAANVEWFYFVSPGPTWEMLAGRAGPVAYCDACGRQVEFITHIVS